MRTFQCQLFLPSRGNILTVLWLNTRRRWQATLSQAYYIIRLPTDALTTTFQSKPKIKEIPRFLCYFQMSLYNIADTTFLQE